MSTTPHVFRTIWRRELKFYLRGMSGWLLVAGFSAITDAVLLVRIAEESGKNMTDSIVAVLCDTITHVGAMVIGFLLLLTYDHPCIRYGSGTVLILSCFFFRRKIITAGKQLLLLKKV